MLQAFGFSEQSIGLIKRIVSKCYFSILVDGEAYGFITATQGLRQGDQLSPALFILMNEVFSRGINVLFERNPSMYFHIPRSLEVSHLAYADDCILFCNGKKTNLQQLNKFLSNYEDSTEQKISLNNSGFVAGKATDSDAISLLLGIPSMSFLFTYLPRSSNI